MQCELKATALRTSPCTTRQDQVYDTHPLKTATELRLSLRTLIQPLHSNGKQVHDTLHIRYTTRSGKPGFSRTLDRVPNFQPNEPMTQKPINDGGPAYPVAAIQHSRNPEWQTEYGFDGMSLRDYFAGQALAGFMANPNYESSAKDEARVAYASADAMLAEREKGGDRG